MAYYLVVLLSTSNLLWNIDCQICADACCCSVKSESQGRRQSVAQIFPGRDLWGWARGTESIRIPWCVYNCVILCVCGQSSNLKVSICFNTAKYGNWEFNSIIWIIFHQMHRLKLCETDRAVKVACMSTLVRNMVDDSGTDEEIPLPNVLSSVSGSSDCWPSLFVLHWCWVQRAGSNFVLFYLSVNLLDGEKKRSEVKTAILSKAWQKQNFITDASA